MRFNPYQQNYRQAGRPSFFEGIRSYLKSRSVPNRIVLVLLTAYAFYLLAWLYMYLFAVPLKVGETDFRFFVKYLVLPSSLEDVIEEPWTIITHIFLHTSFFNLLFYVFIIAVFGKLFFEFWHTARFILLLVVSSFAGAAAFVFTPQMFPVLAETHGSAVLSGAGAAVFGLLFYMFVYMPGYTFVYMMLVRIKMKYIVLTCVVIDLLFYNSEMPGVHLAHLGGAIFGASFAFFSRMIKTRMTSRPRMKVKHRKDSNENPLRTKTDEEYNILKKQRQDKLDAILEKVSKTGYGSLSQEEKDFLFFESKR
jgi:membrane associated rhomboid family serine protease